MSQQPELFAPIKSAPAIRSLFLALFPDADAIRSITSRLPEIRSRHRLTGKLRPDGHWHITLHWIGDYAEVPESVVQAAGRACEAIGARAAPFDITLDRVASFPRRPGISHPIILMGSDEGTAALTRLHGMLLTELIKSGCPIPRAPKFHPHLTLLYDRQDVAQAPMEPVNWTAHEIVLVCSEVGATQYHHLGCWAFGGTES